MHPGMLSWWRARQAGGDECGAWAGCGPSSRMAGPPWGRRWGRGEGSGGGGGFEAAADPFGDVGAGAFGVRRPLRFLAYKLELDDQQVAELAKVLGELKTERAQVEVDGRRVLSGFADALGGASFDEEKAKAAAALRVGSAERLRDAVLKALGRIHGILDDEQRGRLAYLIRTGTLHI